VTSVKAIAELYKKHLKQEHGEESRSSTATIETCIKLYETNFQSAELIEIIHTVEEEWGPIFTLTKMMEISYKLKHSTPKLIWVYNALLDRTRAGAMEPEELTCAAIKIKHAFSPKAVIELSLFKRDALKYVIGKLIDSKNFKPEIKAKIREVFADHDSYRKVRPLNSMTDEEETMTWMAFWPKSARDYFDLCEGIVFQHNCSDEAAMRMGIKHGKTVEAILSAFVVRFAHAMKF
jgi:hypothetical protein